jgi:hypothetical protein
LCRLFAGNLWARHRCHSGPACCPKDTAAPTGELMAGYGELEFTAQKVPFYRVKVSQVGRCPPDFPVQEAH